MKAIVFISGGIIQSITTDRPGLEVIRIDDDVPEDERVLEYPVEVNFEYVRRVFDETYP